MKKNWQVKFLIALCLLFLLSVNSVFAEEVPFEVVKTYVTAEASDPQGSEAVAIDGVLYDVFSEGEKFGYPPPEGQYDTRVRIPVEAVNYKIEFWNVGEMGGEKGFVFKSSYGKAKLTRTYILGQAIQNVEGEEEFMGMHSMETREVGTPDVDTTFVDELTFTGGPYGKFYYVDKKGAKWPIAHIERGREIVFENVPENTDPKKPRHLMSLGYAMDVHPQITDSSAFEKWMEILNSQGSDCSEPGNSKKDSGIRFSDYNGEVMIRPCDDEDAWYGAELDMVLHKDDHIKTGDDSTCVLSLADMTTFVMKPESEIILSSAPEKESKIKLIWGKIKTNFKRMMKDGTMGC
jgi:hypothetical protein